MIAKILPVILLVAGAGIGTGAGIFLKPAPPPEAEDAMMSEEDKSEEMASEEEMVTEFEYLKMSNQFVVPVIEENQVASLIVMSLSLEVPAGQQQVVFTREPKLRDSFLQVMFDHANIGGFSGAFTNATTLETLRNALKEIAARDVGDLVSDVLITEIARQDY